MTQSELPKITLIPLWDQTVPVVDGIIGVAGEAYATPPRYIYKQYLARGASGNTYEAIRTADNKHFALKVICLDKLSSVERLRQESEVACMRSVNHFACVRLYESVMTDRVLFLVMEYCDGGDLSFQIRSMRMQRVHALEVRGADPMFFPTVAATTGSDVTTSQCAGFDEDVLKYVLLQLLLGLHHMHTHCHMLHRDLKPLNVLTTTTGLLKIGDFGFSKSYDTMKDDVAKTFCGTPYYIAPEVWSKKPYGRPADMWSLGVMLYECMTTTLPFANPNLERLRHNILEDAPPPISVGAYSAELKHIVTSLLNKDPSARPDTGALLQTPYVRDALSTFRQALANCPLVNEVMTQAEAALQPAPVYQPNNAVHFEGTVKKLKVTTGEWVPRHLVLHNGELRLERPRRRQATETALTHHARGASAVQSGRYSTESSRQSTFSNLVLPLPGVSSSPMPDAALLQGVSSARLNSTVSTDSNLHTPTITQHHTISMTEDGHNFFCSAEVSPHPETGVHGVNHPSFFVSPPLTAVSPASSATVRPNLASFNVVAIEDILVLSENALALRLTGSQFVFFETPQAASWEAALRECLGWPLRPAAPPSASATG